MNVREKWQLCQDDDNETKLFDQVMMTDMMMIWDEICCSNIAIYNAPDVDIKHFFNLQLEKKSISRPF
jgi:hypothetical protein